MNFHLLLLCVWSYLQYNPTEKNLDAIYRVFNDKSTIIADTKTANSILDDDTFQVPKPTKFPFIVYFHRFHFPAVITSDFEFKYYCYFDPKQKRTEHLQTLFEHKMSEIDGIVVKDSKYIIYKYISPAHQSLLLFQVLQTYSSGNDPVNLLNIDFGEVFYKFKRFLFDYSIDVPYVFPVKISTRDLNNLHFLNIPVSVLNWHYNQLGANHFASLEFGEAIAKNRYPLSKFDSWDKRTFPYIIRILDVRAWEDRYSVATIVIESPKSIHYFARGEVYADQPLHWALDRFKAYFRNAMGYRKVMDAFKWSIHGHDLGNIKVSSELAHLLLTWRIIKDKSSEVKSVWKEMKNDEEFIQTGVSTIIEELENQIEIGKVKLVDAVHYDEHPLPPPPKDVELENLSAMELNNAREETKKERKVLATTQLVKSDILKNFQSYRAEIEEGILNWWSYYLIHEMSGHGHILSTWFARVLLEPLPNKRRNDLLRADDWDGKSYPLLIPIFVGEGGGNVGHWISCVALKPEDVVEIHYFDFKFNNREVYDLVRRNLLEYLILKLPNTKFQTQNDVKLAQTDENSCGVFTMYLMEIFTSHKMEMSPYYYIEALGKLNQALIDRKRQLYFEVFKDLHTTGRWYRTVNK